MSIVRVLGSFPNSQIKPTSAVRDTEVTEIPIAASPAETKALNANDERIRATFINAGTTNLRYDTNPGEAATEGILIQPGRTFSVEGADVEVWITSVGGPGLVQLQDELG